MNSHNPSALGELSTAFIAPREMEEFPPLIGERILFASLINHQSLPSAIRGVEAEIMFMVMQQCLNEVVAHHSTAAARTALNRRCV